MQAGKLTERITIQRYEVTGRDDIGADVLSWANVGTYWACITQEKTPQEQGEKQIKLIPVYSILMRYNDVLPTDRIVWGSQTLVITSAIVSDATQVEFTAKGVA